jgi:lysophospholipid acyltransferase (LPLAT)-like uncharacterized protein
MHGGVVRIRSPLLDKFIGVVGAGVIAAWRETLRIRLKCLSPEVNPSHARHRGEYIFASWHESILAFAFVGMPALYKTQVLISRHQDGEYITQIVQRLGARVARGSTTRGGMAGLLEMIHVDKPMHLAITPDGPRGPRRRLQPGAIYLASRTGLAVVPLGFGFSNAWRARSWDQFAVPLPFSMLVCIAAHPVHVPARLGNDELEYWRCYVEQRMHESTEAAERVAQHWPADPQEPESRYLPSPHALRGIDLVSKKRNS